jgi:hypothetical protein
MKRCPSCGASNPEAATWCSLCLARFGDPAEVAVTQPEAEPTPNALGATDLVPDSVAVPETAVRTEVTAAGIALPSIAIGADDVGEAAVSATPDTSGAGISLPAASSTALASSSGIAPSAEALAYSRTATGTSPLLEPPSPLVQRPTPLARPAGAATAQRGLLPRIERDSMGRLIQRCSLCEAASPIEANECTICGADFLAALREPEEHKEIPPNKALVWGLIPGGGFLPLGMKARFLGHLSLVLWLLGVVFVLIFRSPRALMIFKIGFGFMAAGVWAASAIDASRIAGGQDDAMLSGKRPVIVFAASLALLFVMAFVLTWQALRHQPEPAGGGSIYDIPPSPASIVQPYSADQPPGGLSSATAADA